MHSLSSCSRRNPLIQVTKGFVINCIYNVAYCLMRNHVEGCTSLPPYTRDTVTVAKVEISACFTHCSHIAHTLLTHCSHIAATCSNPVAVAGVSFQGGMRPPSLERVIFSYDV